MELDMAPKLSMSSDEADDVAFKVLNQDNLPAISVIGEPIFKPFGQDFKSKPNLVVHPTRRIVTNLEDNKQKGFTKSHGHIDGQYADKKLKGRFSSSHGHLNHHNSSSKIKPDDFKKQVDVKFTKTLDAKLRRLQKKENQNKKTGGSDIEKFKKPFVTTVKKGKFLEPPPEKPILNFKVADEHSEKKNSKLYAYSSQPRVLNREPKATNKDPKVLTRSPPKIAHLQQCAAAFMAAKIAGGVAGLKNINEGIENKKNEGEITYGNVMYDKRVFRGSNFAQQHAGDGESAAARAAEARRRALARRKAKNQHYNNSRLRLGSPPPVAGRRHENIQTEHYLEELFVNPPLSDVCTQTDLFLERPVSPFYVPAKTGADVDTQIYPGDLFDFDLEVQPILEVLVGKTVEQALIEVLEEEELASLREQQRRFLELRAVETAEVLRLKEREKRLTREKNKRVAEHEDGVKLQKEMEERIAAAVLTQSYMADVLPSVLEGLQSEGFLANSVKEDIDDSFMPWLVKEVTQELQDMVCSRDLLSDIVREILENRAEIYKALNKESSTDETEEEGPSVQEMMLQDHFKLQQEIEGEEIEPTEQHRNETS
ncbi:radial spoke head protein 3 homolog isoform X2 [Cylas formicarius]|uniref:radial spoke head protein 3 homolog isoform X2 n=1 Tax=Cylas formicarius TaxID=197179 RepID=UPI002958CE2B|nr:radial spoke head protein 3 homolog isoform X2 [Cylas formicarius]